MAASVMQIILPSADESDLRKDLDSSRFIPGWDQNVGAIPKLVLPPKNAVRKNRNSISFHAIAHGHTVVGTLPSWPKMNDGDENGGVVTKWQTSLDNEVVTVASNDDGSVIASATGTHVSLLKGRDGSILATRQIVPVEYNRGRPSNADLSVKLLVSSL